MFQKDNHKDKRPEETVSTIEGILQNANLLYKSDSWFTKQSGTWWSRVYLLEPGVNKQRTFSDGKGLSKIASLASAYGELMERLQGDVLVEMPYRPTFRIDKIQKHNRLDFYFAPDEKYLNASQLTHQCNKFLKQLFKTKDKALIKNLLRSHLGNKIALVPFQNYCTKSVEYLPIEAIQLACSANGYASGNTREEALTQALCEILERWAFRNILIDCSDVSNISFELLNGTLIYDRLTEFQSMHPNLKISIKDCSFGSEVPIIGLLIEDSVNGLHKFHLGCAPSISEALSRCLTEIYQGNTAPLHKVIAWPDLASNPLWMVAEFKERNLMRAYKNQPFSIPPSILNSTNASDKIFQNFHSNKQVAQTILESEILINRTIWMRDVGYLGWPSVIVYIEGFSEINTYFIKSNSDLKKKTFDSWEHLCKKYRTPMEFSDAVRSKVDLHAPGQEQLDATFFLPAFGATDVDGFEGALAYFRKVNALKTASILGSIKS